mmetsp:Transcript_69141/g.165814  ORF Transcript_69141/g.165814 Transcript_69141/m.165814 type:complete len:301 (+) Transcript_69141:82-984(+)
MHGMCCPAYEMRLSLLRRTFQVLTFWLWLQGARSTRPSERQVLEVTSSLQWQGVPQDAEGTFFAEEAVSSTGAPCEGETLIEAMKAEHNKTTPLCKQECLDIHTTLNEALSNSTLLKAWVENNTNASLPCDESDVEAIAHAFAIGCDALTCLADCSKRHRPSCSSLAAYNEWCEKEFVGKFTEIMISRLNLHWYVHRLKDGHGSPAGECQQRVKEVEQEVLENFPLACFPSTCAEDDQAETTHKPTWESTLKPTAAPTPVETRKPAPALPEKAEVLRLIFEEVRAEELRQQAAAKKQSKK